MVHQERLEMGEKWFVASVMSVLATEAAWTIVANGLHFSWIGVLLGIAGFCLVMFLANRLYAGNRQARQIALGWVGFQVVYGVACFLLLAANQTETAQMLGAPALWLVVLKAAVYLWFGWVLMRMPVVRDFFADKRGEYQPEPLTSAAVVAPPLDAGVPVEFTADHTEHVTNLAKFLRYGVAALILLGVLQIIWGSLQGFDTRGGMLSLAEGMLTLVLGVALGGPSSDVSALQNKEDQNTAQLTETFDSFLKFYRVQALAGLALAGILIVRMFVP